MMRLLLAEAAFRLPRVRGKDRLMRGAIRAISGSGTTVITRGAVRYAVGGIDLIDYYIMSHETESPIVVDLLSREIGDRAAVFWDIGANVGGVALPLLRRCKNLTAVLFEPSPSVCGRLMHNLQLNPDLAARATVISAALSDTTGWAEFFPSGHVENSGIGGLASAGNRLRVGLKVACCRADALPEDIPRPDIVKIDVEGFELEVLQGMGRLLKSRPSVLFEHQPSLFPPRGLAVDAVVRHLERLGYAVTSTRYVSVDLDRSDDLFAKPSQGPIE